ncbi:MAG: DNA-processing protein DprA [Planctomycetota bacterium]
MQRSNDRDDATREDDLRDLLQLVLLPGLGPRTLTELLRVFDSPAEVLRADGAKLKSVSGIGDKLVHTIQTSADHVDVDDVLHWCEHHEAHLVVRGDDDYPESIDQLDDAPPILFVQGDFRATDLVSVAIVGTRHATPYGLQQSRRLAIDLANAGVTVISGMARGIDTSAHRATLEGGGRTIAFLGGGLGRMYPAENQSLADQISASGAVVSEYAPFAKPKSGCFPQRNRLIAAMSAATLVIEAPTRSGALITARLASELGRNVGALPGSVVSRSSRGCHELIRDGATLVQHIDDVLELLGPMATSVSTVADELDHDVEVRAGRELLLNDIERRVLAAVDVQGTSIDALTSACDLPASRVAAVLSILEVKSHIRRLSGQYVARV